MGNKKMKTLILYASKNGCAEDAAKYFANKLSPNADCFDLRKYGDKDMREYDWVVTGGSVYAGQVMKEAVRFCEQNASTLLTKNIALFVSCTTPDRAVKYMQNAFPAAVFSHATEKINFGGEIRPEKLSFLMRKAMELMSKRSGGSGKTGIAYDVIDAFTARIGKV